VRIEEFTHKEEMLASFPLIKEMYPTITLEEYSNELDIMLPNDYKQIVVFEGDKMIGISGYWVGNKLWCGKYLELDNVFTSPEYRSKGVGDLIFSHLEIKAKDLKCTMLALDSYTDNFKAHKFFYDKGYIPRGFHFINILDKTKIR
jgi:GNAT superfamily N-acetyltransferase